MQSQTIQLEISSQRLNLCVISASPPLPPPPDSGNDAFDYQQNAPLPPPQFSDDHDTRMMIAPPPEDPYAATGPGFLGPEDWVPAQYIEKGELPSFWGPIVYSAFLNVSKCCVNLAGNNIE